MNNINLIGRLGGDPEVKYFESGTNVAKFSIAVDRPQRNGEKGSDWFACECWGKTAEVVGNYCRKGKQVGVTGRVEFEYWNDKNTGEKRSKPVVKVDRLDLLSDSGGAIEGQPQRKPMRSASSSANDADDFPPEF